MTEPWKVCRDWLIDCKVIQNGNRLTQFNAEIFDLAQLLRDGVVLCQLLNMIKPGTVDLRSISIRPQMFKFSCTKNINVFLQACATTFKLSQSQLFAADSLYDVSDFEAVIRTLSYLSKTPESCAIAKPFELEEQKYEDEDIYKNLEDLADNHDVADEIYETMDQDDDNEGIYDDLVTLRERLKPEQEKTKLTPLDKRKYCVDEIVDTEERYVDALGNLVSKFIRPLSSVLTKDDKKKIFMNIEDLHSRHLKFSKELSRSRDNGTVNMSDIFIKHKGQFLIYGFYCSFLTNAQRHIDEVCKNVNVVKKIEECQMKYNENKFSLRDLLNVPMQRILKYHLLLRELIKHTDKSHPDRSGLDKALEEMQDLSQYVNEVKRDHENMQTNSEMEKSLVNYHGCPLNEFGRILKDGDLKIKMGKASRGPVNSNCFLFDKALLICEKKGKGQETHEFKHLIKLSQYEVEDNLPKGKGKWNWCFWLTPKEGIPELTPVEIYTKTEEMMLRWVTSIKTAKDNINPKHGTHHKFEFTSFTDPTYCEGCMKLLRGVFFQGYKCTRCRKAAHKDCLTKKIIMACVPRRPTTSSKKPVIDVAKARSNYSGLPPPPDNHTPVKFDKGHVLEIYDKVDDYWWIGCNTSTLQTGYIPTKYLERPQYQETTITPGNSIRQPGSPHPHPSNLFEYKWFVGTMERASANEQLKDTSDGCFLVRERGEGGGYAISIRYDNTVKHMKVLVTIDRMFYLVEAHPFATLPQLIEYYQKNTLAHVFQGLDSILSIPIREYNKQCTTPQRNPLSPRHSVCSSTNNHTTPPTDNGITHASQKNVVSYGTALYDFSARGIRELSLKTGQTVAIISKAGGHRGWWKGRVGDKEGYFPSTYVQEED
ncbi:guanine nucleotide exchange factor VAV2-like isoform X2 [Antedon mediterranea]|uniref:guanine nucleotide exchange factor VAV2-like isoform X2 n=1 Tax=Antedon mediterranea TaxID=105859 RepID=UPI003AF79AFC